MNTFREDLDIARPNKQRFITYAGYRSKAAKAPIVALDIGEEHPKWLDLKTVQYRGGGIMRKPYIQRCIHHEDREGIGD